MNILIIDNYDSFTFNLYQYVGEILTAKLGHGFNITVKRNDAISMQDIQAMQPDRIIISPGPGSPDDDSYFGICAEVIKTMGKTTPILGVCLGMQGIAHVFGGQIVRAELPMHGKVSNILHDETGVFTDLPQQLSVMRYHSLKIANDSLPECLRITAVVDEFDCLGDTDVNAMAMNTTHEKMAHCLKHDAEIMGIKHKNYPIEGVQFHPESFATEGAMILLANFLMQAS